MKIAKILLMKTAVALALLAPLGGQTHAACTNYQAELQAAAGAAYGVLTNELANTTNNPPLTSPQKKKAAALTRAITFLTTPATNTAQAYNLFLKAAQALGPLALQGQIGAAGSNLFTAFLQESVAEIECTGDRIAALNEFVRSRRAASNQLVQARRTLVAISQQSNPQIGLLLGRQVYQKIVVANRLAAIGEAKPGHALSSVVGKTLVHTESDHTGNVQFTSDTEATESDSEGTNAVNYTYTRTGLHTATLVLTRSGDMGGTETTTVHLRFQSTSNGTFSYRHEDSDGSTENGNGTFTIN
jgi:hypothetical protein